MAGGSSVYAQGGVAVALGADDSPERHAADTVAVGGGLTDRGVAVRVAREGAGRVVELLRLGLRLDRDPGGRLALGREAAHSRRRVAHADGDATGAELVRALAEAVVASERARIEERVFALELLRDGERVVGVLTVDRQGRSVAHLAPAVVLATGGIGRVYRATTNPPEGTGDGLAMAARAGARLADLEFVQFHPTALADGSDPMALLTEALRGEGAVLVDERGERFMVPLHPAAELAPRDVVARGIWRHLEAGHRAFLDATGIGPELPGRFPTVFAAVPGAGPRPEPGADPGRPGGPLPHGRGERRPARSHLPARAVGVRRGGRHRPPRRQPPGLQLAARGAGLRGAGGGGAGRGAAGTGGRLPSADLERRLAAAAGVSPWLDADPAAREAADRLRGGMWRSAGLERCGDGLRGARRARRPGPGRRTGELANLLLVGRLVATAALAREESRGAHYRSDFPASERRWRRHLVFVGERLSAPVRRR